MKTISISYCEEGKDFNMSLTVENLSEIQILEQIENFLIMSGAINPVFIEDEDEQ